MKAFLLYRDRDFDLERPLSTRQIALIQDLGLDPLFAAMAAGDEFLLEIARKGVLSSLDDVDAVLYRQTILQDCLRQPQLVRELHQLAIDAIDSEKKPYWLGLARYPSSILRRALDLLTGFVGSLKRLRGLVDRYGSTFQSEGLTRLCAMLREELDDNYFRRIEDHLRILQFRGGLLLKAGLGTGLKGDHYAVRQPKPDTRGWFERLFGPKPLTFTCNLHPRDEAGARALSQLNDQGLNLVANALAQSADHILNFFRMLRRELAFYVAGLNLHERLAALGEPVCFPEPAPFGSRALSSTDLHDVCLALVLGKPVVGNFLSADGKDLVLVTGANRGGKSTFLRSVGQAQLMTQAGMFVAAHAFRAEMRDRLYTHYKREEDKNLQSGKLDEELKRMSAIAEGLTGRSMVLFNESFAATNEREGSEIASQIVEALNDKGVKMVFVTHLYQFAHRCYAKGARNALFLRAERREGGARTFRVVEGEPLKTSFGRDLYEKAFDPARPPEPELAKETNADSVASEATP